MMIRGPDSAPFDLVDKYNRSGPDWYSAWQSEAEVDPTLHSRESDKMRPHEKLLVVAINRKTGYIGTMRTEYGKNYKNGIISPIVPKDKRIVLRPPNLKISAERMYKIEKGFIPSDERDKEHEYLIGHEGAALKSDVWVKVTTEWFDHDGSPLPKDLEEEGYTARLAKIAGENELVAQGGDFAQFSLKPGRHTENIQITGEGSLAEHFYVQVSGEKKDENPDFSTLGAGAGPLQYRPENYVPFKVAIPDETLTWEQFTAYKKLKKQEGNEDLEEPKPIYKWFYRPEMQFSLFDLKVKDILRETRDENGTDISVTVYNNKAPIISSSDDLTKVLYNLLEQTIEPLQFLGNKQQLVFALGEEELAAELGQDKQLKFINLEHLTKLDIEDYLSLRLYNNHDPGNILWQYAFAQLVLFPLPSEEVPFTRLSADDVERIYHSATIVNELEEPIEVRWEYESDEGVTFDPPSQKNADGLYTTHATLPTTADTEVEIYAVQTENPTARILSSKYRIAPGKPAVLEVEQSGKMAIDEIGEVTLTVTAKDDFDNLVEDGTAVQVQSDNLVITGNAQTVDGKATFTLRGGFDVGQQDVTVQVGELVETVSVDVLDVDIQISIPAEVEVGANMPIYVQATSAYGDLSGVPIMIKGTRVALDKHIYTLGSGNIVDIRGFVGNYVGEGNIMVAIGDKFERSDFKVIDTSGVTVLDNVVVSGVQGKSSFTVNGAIYEYTGETAVVVSGNEGDEYTASLVDYLDPPILPELRFTMQNEVKFNQIFDEMLDVPAHVTSVDRTYNPFESLKYAMDFDASSLMRIEHLELKDISSPGVVFNLNVSALGSGSIHRIASLDNVGINIDLNESRQVVLSQTDGVNTVSITSPEINLESWIKVGAHLVNGQLVLQVNDEIVKSSDALPIVDNASHLIVIGGGFNGQISQFTAYDWDAEKIITFDDGSLDKTVEIGPTGKGVLKVNVGAVNLFAEHQTRKYQRLYKKFGDSYFEVAFALGNDCTPIDMSAIDSFDTALNTGAAMAGFLADCEILPKIKEAFITIKSDSSAWRKAIAVADFATYTAVYISAKTTELALILGPECAEGAITGNVTGFASATCDIITSFFLIGDLRDFAIHSWHMYGWGDIKKFNYAVYIFAGLGIASSGASVLGGVGIPANIGFAGCKAAAKLFNSAFIKALAKYFNKEVGGNLTNLSKLGDALKLSLPMIQLVGAAIVLKDVAPKVWDGLKEIKAEQIVGMMRYFRTMLEKLQDDINTVSVLDKNEFNLLVEAYALNADALLNLLGRTAKETSAIKTAINRIQRTFDYPPEYVRGGDTKFKELFNEGLSKFGGKIDDLSDNELAKIVAEDKFMLALVLVQDMAKNTSKSGQDMVDAIRRMPCNPGPRGCINSGASKDEMVEFFANFEKLADAKVAGRIDDVAWSSLSRVITDMGQKVGQNTDNAAVRRVNSAKGASANLAEITAQVSEKGAKLVKAEEPIPTNLNVGVHKADHIIEVDGKTLNREVKNWEPDVIAKSLAGSLKGSKKVDGKLEPAGQLHKNFVDIFNKGLHKKVEDINYEWVFTKGELSKIKKDLVRQITNNDANLKAAMIASQNPSLVKMARGNTKADIDALEDFKKTILPQIVNKIIVKSL